MKTKYQLIAGLTYVAVCAHTAAANADVGTGPSFKGPIGLQLYSLRDQLAKDPLRTLDKVRDMGIKNVELSDLYKMTPEKLKAELSARGLKAISAHFPYEKYRDDPESIATTGRALGLQFSGCGGIPHSGPFDEKTCRDAIRVFNRAGEVLAKHGIRFFYHTHGYEFAPHAQGTLFDLMMSETNPKYVAFQMDVFWVVHGGQDPVTLLEKYAGRFQLAHLKDMRHGTPVGLLTGTTAASNDVALGQGKIPYRPILRAAEKAGVKSYFIEDESADSEQQIPISLRYLEKVTW